MEAGEVQPVSLPEPAIVHHVDEGEGEDPEVDQVLPVDPGEADGQDRAQTERARGQRGMFAAGSCETDSDRGPKGEPDVYVVRTSTLTGLDVVNEKEKSLGSVSDMVVDLKTGQIQYVATSYGGFPGIGEKMFAIPCLNPSGDFNRRRRPDPLGEGHACTWRTRLFKLAAEVFVTARRVVVRVSSHWPFLPAEQTGATLHAADSG